MEKQQKFAKITLIILTLCMILCTIFFLWTLRSVFYAGFVFAAIGGPIGILSVTVFMLMCIIVLCAPLGIGFLIYRRGKYLVAIAISVIGFMMWFALIPVGAYLSKSSAPLPGSSAPAIYTFDPSILDDQPPPVPRIFSVVPSSGPIGTVVTIKGQDLSALEGDLDVIFERQDGQRIFLTDSFGDYAKTQGTLIKVVVKEPCQPGETVYGSYSGISSQCDYVKLSPGIYKVYASPWGTHSNAVNFTLTN